MSLESIDPSPPIAVFHRLVVDICKRLGIAAPEFDPAAEALAIREFVASGAATDVGHHGHSAEADPPSPVIVDFTVDDVDITLVHRAGAHPARVKLVCRLGPCPAARRVDVLERLLELNLALTDQPVRLALDPVDGTALLITDYALVELDVERTLYAFDLATQHATRWRASHFLEAASPSPGAMRIDLSSALLA